MCDDEVCDSCKTKIILKPYLIMENYTQLCLWAGTVVGPENIAAFESYMLDVMGVRIKYAEEVVTLPTLTDGVREVGTGGRTDVLFYVHDDDISKFAIKKLEYGIRWWEDVIKYNPHHNIYPNAIMEKYQPTW